MLSRIARSGRLKHRRHGIQLSRFAFLSLLAAAFVIGCLFGAQNVIHSRGTGADDIPGRLDDIAGRFANEKWLGHANVPSKSISVLEKARMWPADVADHERLMVDKHCPTTKSCAFVTLITKDWYAPGVAGLMSSHKRVKSSFPVVCMVTKGVSNDTERALADLGCLITRVPFIEMPANNTLIRKSFAETFTKLHAWKRVEYGRVILIDGDMIFLKNVDFMFGLDLPGEVAVAAAEDCCGYFNSGFMVIQPSVRVYDDMLARLPSSTSYDGGDQGFLNTYFADGWVRLSFVFNADQTMLRQNRHAWSMAEVYILHFVKFKPWRISLADARAADVDDFYRVWRSTVDEPPSAMQNLVVPM